MLSETLDDGSRSDAIWKIDYQGNFIDHVLLPEYARGDLTGIRLLDDGTLICLQDQNTDECQAQNSNSANAVLL